MKLDFKGKVVFITGGSSGIGEQICKSMIELGAKTVVIAARKQEELDRVKRESKDPSRVLTIIMDLSKPEECLKQA